MKKPIEEDYRYPTTGNASAIDYAEYSRDLDLYIKHLEEKHNNDIHGVRISFPTVEQLHNTPDGRYIMRCISFPIADKFNTHPEKITDVVEQIAKNIKGNEA